MSSCLPIAIGLCFNMWYVSGLWPFIANKSSWVGQLKAKQIFGMPTGVVYVWIMGMTRAAWVGQERVWVGHGLPGLIARTASEFIVARYVGAALYSRHTGRSTDCCSCTASRSTMRVDGSSRSPASRTRWRWRRRCAWPAWPVTTPSHRTRARSSQPPGRCDTFTWPRSCALDRASRTPPDRRVTTWWHCPHARPAPGPTTWGRPCPPGPSWRNEAAYGPVHRLCRLHLLCCVVGGDTQQAGCVPGSSRPLHSRPSTHTHLFHHTCGSKENIKHTVHN